MRLLLLCTLLMAGTACYAQQPIYTLVKDTTVNLDTVKRPMPMVDVKPKFKGNINEYLAKNVRMPKGVKPSGKVTALFVIDTLGNVGMVSIEGKKPDEKLTALEKEIVRAIKVMPKWTPGERGGKKVPVKYSLPINLN